MARVTKVLGDEQVTEILQRVKNGEAISSLAKEYDIGKTTIRDWISGRSRTGNSFDPNSSTLSDHKLITKLKKENKALYEILGQVTVELKKQQQEI
jgi:transposase-like protein